MAYTYEQKYTVADSALLMIALEIVKNQNGEQTDATTLDEIATIVGSYREIRIGEMVDDE